MKKKAKEPKAKMKVFRRIRTLSEIKDICKERKWNLCTKKFDEGSDFVRFEFKIKTLGKDVSGWALYNTFNGRFFGELKDGIKFDSNSTEHEGKRWFNILLETAYAA